MNLDFIDRLSPELQADFAALPPFSEMVRRDPGTRALFDGIQEQIGAQLSPAREIDRRTKIIDGPGGPLELTLYYPPGEGPHPCLIWFHGGGFVLGSSHDPIYAPQAAAAARCVVISPSYRLAPEHPAPAALQDALATLRWTASHAPDLDIDPDRIGVGGASAGGGLAAGLALYARDLGGPSLRFQWLLYPMLDDRHDNPAANSVTDPRVWNRETSLWAWSLYRGEPPASLYAAAARATDLSNLPPAYLCVGGCDLFRDEVIAYASRLIAAGVSTGLLVVPGMYHGGENLRAEASVSQSFRRQYHEALAAFARASESGG